MHLTAIHIRGFKSFPDPVEIRLERGVAVVVGPNGSGKSNVADALLWAAGSLSPTELRAEKADDVLYAGAGARPPARYCEVELRFDNSDGAWEGLPFTEISIARRLHHGGEGQYLVNGAGVRRTDLVELLADVGLASGVTVIGQGRVEEILASSPAERRAMIEEAAGVGRFKRRRHRAELKLARVAQEVERARDVEREVHKRLRPLALQASAAERAERLRGETGELRRTIDAVDLAGVHARIAALDERRAAASLERRRRDAELEELLRERNGAEEELADAAGRREAATGLLYRLRSAGDRIALRRESVGAVHEELQAQAAVLPAGDARAGAARAELAREAAAAERRAREAALERDQLAARVELVGQRLGLLERSLGEREGLSPAARALAEAGERLALSLLEVEEGYERAVAAALSWRAGAVVADTPGGAVALLERARESGLGAIGVLVGSGEDDAGGEPLPGARPLSAHIRAREGGDMVAARLAGAWLVPVERLLDARSGLVVTLEGHRYEPERGELFFAGETAEAVLLELDARRRAVATELAELEQALARTAERSSASRRAADAAAAALAAVAPSVAADPAVTRRAHAAVERLIAVLDAAAETARRHEAPLRARVEAGSERTHELAEQLRRLAGGEAELRRAAADVAGNVSALDVERARLRAEADELRRRVGDERADAPPDGADRAALTDRLERLERRLAALGPVNPLAKEEYERERERLAELAEQRGDLERSLDELDRLRRELTEAVDQRFAETFAAVRGHFADVAAALFPGGEGRLRLTQPDADADADDAEPGVEIDLRPADKRVTRLSLLSGGEKALGAISFLFALFLARPSPFYLLDEVEAALDDTNIGRFVDLLRRYADRAQFIIVTHQKRTMEAADALYGVTMGADGVSEIVSRRTPREPTLAAVS